MAKGRQSSPLTVGRLKELLRYEPGSGNFIWLTHRKGQHPPGTVAGRLRADGYIAIRIDGLAYQAHRLAWLYMTGKWPPEEVDHWNLDKADNAWENLRPATHRQNMTNVRPRSKRRANGLKGAHPRGLDRWVASMSIDGRTKYLGIFYTEIEAHAAYVAAAVAVHGQFARAE